MLCVHSLKDSTFSPSRPLHWIYIDEWIKLLIECRRRQRKQRLKKVQIFFFFFHFSFISVFEHEPFSKVSERLVQFSPTVAKRSEFIFQNLESQNEAKKQRKRGKERNTES